MGIKKTAEVKSYKKLLCFDLDNTLCLTRGSDYENSRPIIKNIKFVNNLYDNGFYILIFTARYMGRFNENKSKVVSYGYRKTHKQLCKWGLMFHKLEMGKPSYDYIVDDKSIFYKKNWTKELRNKLKNK